MTGKLVVAPTELNSNTYYLKVLVNPTAELMQRNARVLPQPGGGYRASFIGNPGTRYKVEMKPTLNATNWIDLATVEVDPNGNFSYLDNSPPGTTSRFYRVRGPMP